ncbi:hypothetical protein ACHQM5_022684 [Ranunculus cassubicifolius]
MAVDFSISRPSFIFSIKYPSNSNTFLRLKTPIFPRNLQYKSTNLGFPTTTRRSFKSFVTVEDAQSEGPLKKFWGRMRPPKWGQLFSRVSERKPAAKFSPELKTLIDAYKKAVLSGDEAVVSEIEATICVLENETNALGQKVESLIEDIASQKEKFIFVQADLENFRKKFDKDRLRLTSRTQKDVLASLLPIVDSFEGTKQQIAPETEMAKKIDTSYQGIYKQFVEILRSLNVSIVQTVGKPFDPSVHEAIAREESQVVKDGVVIREVRRGFILGDQILRPAGVIVSGGPGTKKAPAPTMDSEGQPTTVGVDGE